MHGETVLCTYANSSHAQGQARLLLTCLKKSHCCLASVRNYRHAESSSAFFVYWDIFAMARKFQCPC